MLDLDRLARRARTIVRHGHFDDLREPWLLEPIKADTPADEANLLVRFVAFIAAASQGTAPDVDRATVDDTHLRALAVIDAALVDDRAALHALQPDNIADLHALLASLAGMTSNLLREGAGDPRALVATYRRAVLERATETTTDTESEDQA